MAFYVGQKVVCIDDGPTHRGVPSGLKKGAIYTIVRIGPRGGLDLAEAEAWHDEFHYPFYKAKRFRPIVERKTDISIFMRMLTDAKAPEKVQS